MRVAVIGAGSWGTTVASVLSEHCDTTLWAREPEVAEAITGRRENPRFLPGFSLPVSLQVTTALSGALADRQLVLMAVPTQHLRSVADGVADNLAPDTLVLSLAKGIERTTLLRPSQILAQVLSRAIPSEAIGVLSGPNLAREVMAGEPSATVVALGDKSRAEMVQALLMSDHLRVYTSQDVIGCEIGGAVKNVIAIAVGMATGLGYGWNSRSALITRGLAELTRLGVALGGDPLTFLGLAGVGDLVATASSEHSRNRRVGVELGRGRHLEEILAETAMVAEGVWSARAVLSLAHDAGVEMPVTQQVATVVEGQLSATEVVGALMGRAPTSELHDLQPPGTVRSRTPRPRAPGSSRVRDVMTTEVVTLRPDDPVEAAAAVLVDHDIGGAPVIDEHRAVVGMLADDHLVMRQTRLHVPTALLILLELRQQWPPPSVTRFQAEIGQALATTVGQAMEPDPPTCGPDDSIEDAATLLHVTEQRRLPVVHEGRLVGIVTRSDLLRLLVNDH